MLHELSISEKSSIPLIDVTDVTKYNRSQRELEMFLLLAIVVAGKTAQVQNRLLTNFFHIAWELSGDFNTPFDAIRNLVESDNLFEAVKRSHLGQWNRLTRCFKELVSSDINLQTCSCEELESIFGIKFKTSRFFVVHSREGVNYSILDTHILRFMRDILGMDTPKNTPSNLKEYQRIEKDFVNYCESLGRTPASLDLEIWVRSSQKGNAELL